MWPKFNHFLRFTTAHIYAKVTSRSDKELQATHSSDVFFETSGRTRKLHFSGSPIHTLVGNSGEPPPRLKNWIFSTTRQPISPAISHLNVMNMHKFTPGRLWGSLINLPVSAPAMHGVQWLFPCCSRTKSRFPMLEKGTRIRVENYLLAIL